MNYFITLELSIYEEIFFVRTINKQCFSEFGVKGMEFLATHFKHFLSVESGDIPNEWELLKVLVYER